jgi:putative ABC transport system permease protein
VRKVTLRGLLAHKLRLALTALAIVLGVTFISGTLMLTDTLNNSYNSLFTSVYNKVDFQVRGAAQVGTGASATRNPLAESVLTQVSAVPGVAGAYGQVQGYAQFVAPDGKPISSATAPTLAEAFNTDPQISSLHLTAGKPPTTSGDVVMDAGTASTYHFSVGQRVRVLTTGAPQTYTISGIAQYGAADNLAGSTLAAFTLPTAQQVTGQAGQLDSINVVTKPGADKAAVQKSVAAAAGSGAEVVTGQTVVKENASTAGQDTSFITTALLVFALIALFVGAFTIYNTFSIIVGQRTRELALLRVVGASRRQVFRSVLSEAAIVGLVSSAAGVGLGVAAAVGLEALVRTLGTTLPAGPLIFEPRTAIAGLLVGTLVTVISAIGPARNAVRVPPVAALTDRPAEDGGAKALRRRLIIGGAVTVAGVALLAVGLTAPLVALVGIGAACLFVGVTMLTPALARPLSGLIGRPLGAALGTPGRLGRENSMRSPRRTAQTASALMIGLALVSAIAVFGASLTDSFTGAINKAISADLLVTADGTGQLSGSVPAAAAAVPGVTASEIVYRDQFAFEGTAQTITGLSPDHIADTVILRMASGSAAALDQGQLLIDSTTATAKHLVVGDTAKVKFAATGATTVRIGGIYQTNGLIESYLVSSAFFVAHFKNPGPGAVLLRDNGSSSVTTAVTQALNRFGNVQVQTRQQFEQAGASGLNALLGIVYVLLALAVLIALAGIVNTLMLSVLERTREIGLLRAVGMRRSQVRAMIRSEAVILSVFGAVIGIVVGTLMGLAFVSSLRQQGLTETDVPFTRLVLFLVLAAVLGLVAASWPARRAARLDVLAAIAAQ